LENILIFGYLSWFLALYVAIQVAFFKLVSRGITLAKNETVDFGDWTAEDVSPEKQRQFIKTSFFLFVMVPLLLFALAAGFDAVYTIRNFFWNWESLDPYAIGISNQMFWGIICIGTVLSVLAAFWGTIKPHRRNQIYAALFLGIGIWVFITVEQAPLMHYEPVRNFLYGWLEKGNLDFQIADSSKINFFYYHLFAGSCLTIYTALAAWFALRRSRIHNS
jgi:succinate dehydrogenase/fumarate reductase cytochrome b subunit